MQITCGCFRIFSREVCLIYFLLLFIYHFFGVRLCVAVALCDFSALVSANKYVRRYEYVYVRVSMCVLEVVYKHLSL